MHREWRDGKWKREGDKGDIQEGESGKEMGKKEKDGEGGLLLRKTRSEGKIWKNNKGWKSEYKVWQRSLRIKIFTRRHRGIDWKEDLVKK